MRTPCSIEDCDQFAYGRGWCKRHYERWRLHGDPLKTLRPVPLADRFWSRVNKTDTCWLWTGSCNEHGYGQIRRPGGKMEKAHRLSYEITLGAIPEGVWVLHRCDNPPCVNPAHLFLGTCRDNIADKVAKGRARGRWSGVTHCVHGHPFDEKNTALGSDGTRTCRACRSRRTADARLRKRKALG